MRLVAVMTLAASFVALPAPDAAAAGNPWAQLLEADVEAMHRLLLENHPGPVDTLNKGFSRWLEAGRRQALERAKTCTSFEGHRFALEAYAAGFRDGHLSAWTDLRRDEVRWPGFMAGWQASDEKNRGRLVVRVVGQVPPDEPMPVIGSEVISCDGKTPAQLLERDVFPFRFNPELESSWVSAAPLLLVDEANPWRAPMPRTCTIRENEVVREHVLKWRALRQGRLWAHVDAAQERAKSEFVIRPFGERGIWVAMPSFSASSESVGAALKTAIAQARSWRDRDPIVFDVRGNAGGSSMWGQQLLEALYGEALLASRIEPLSAKQYVEWRVSPGNLAHIKTMVGVVVGVNGAGSEAERRTRSVLEGVERALAEGRSLWRAPDVDRKAPVSPAPANPVGGRVVLLTDGACASACLDFADRVRSLPGTQHVGRTTTADSVYMEARLVPLPSGTATLYLATKVYRNRPRAHNQPHVPHRIWRGNIADTAALERWILSLPRTR